MPTVAQARRCLLEALQAAGVEASEAQREADLIIEHASGLSKARQMAEPEAELSEAAAARIAQLQQGRQKRVPLQYLLGEQWFMGLPFRVRPGVLIPRADTEVLVEVAVKFLAACGSQPRFVDIGSGSGAIAVSVLHALAQAQGFAVDISPIAAETTRENATALGVGDRLTVAELDWQQFEPPCLLDAVLSNPPYVPLSMAAELQPEVSVYEPQLAIFGSGADGLGFFRELARRAGGYLRDGGLLLVEVGQGQSDAVRALFQPPGWRDVNVHFDLSGIARCISAVHAVEAIEKQS